MYSWYSCGGMWRSFGLQGKSVAAHGAGPAWVGLSGAAVVGASAGGG